MRDFPIFTTEYGVSSLILREIPYKKTAYIRIRDVQREMLEEHMKECVSFCRIAGAERVFAAGDGLKEYPEHTRIFGMQASARVDGKEVACLFPVTEATVTRWRTHYNKAMAGVDHAQILEARDEKRILEKPGAYFIHDNGQLLGIGWLDGSILLAVAATQRGAGERVMHTLMSLVEGQIMTLEVASSNEKAIRLYEKLGFVQTGVRTVWYDASQFIRG